MTPGPRRFLRRRLYRYVRECEETRQETAPPTIRSLSGQFWGSRRTERKMVETANRKKRLFCLYSRNETSFFLPRKKIGNDLNNITKIPIYLTAWMNI